MTRKIVLFGTGTEIGKTYVGCALTAALNELGAPTLGLKPIESGVGTNEPSDAAQLRAVSPNRFGKPGPLHCYALAEPISPHLAARREGVALDFDRIRAWVDEQTSQYDTLQYTLIETAGGVFSPLHDTATNFELAQHFGEALWVLVAPDRLGVLHDVTACLIAMRQRGRHPDAVVLNCSQSDTSSGTNADELARLGITQVDASVGHGRADGIRPLALRLAREAGG